MKPGQPGLKRSGARQVPVRDVRWPSQKRTGRGQVAVAEGGHPGLKRSGAGQAAITQQLQRQPSLIRRSRPGAQALHHPVGLCTWVRALIGVRPGPSGHAQCAGAQRRCWMSANCWSAAGVDLCGTVARRARRRIGPRTRPHANGCKPHEGEIAASIPLNCFTWAEWCYEECLVPRRTDKGNCALFVQIQPLCR
jgi:hypothetical protein